MKNFIQTNATEAEQVEKLKQWWDENRTQIIIAIAVGIAGIFAFNYWGNYQQKQAINARGYYLSLVANPESSYDFNELQGHHPQSDYAKQGTLLLAKQAVEKKSYQQALDYLAPLLNDENELIVHVATLRTAAIELQMGNYQQALTTLETQDSEDFGSLYNQLKGDVYLALNDIPLAKQYYQIALSQITENSNLKNLIQIKLNNLN